MMRLFCSLLTHVLVLLLVSCSASVGAGDKDKKEPDKTVKQKDPKEAYLLVVPSAGGKEIKLAGWRFTHGARHLSFGSEAPANPKTKTPTGPEYLEFREEKSTSYKNGIFTFVPLSSIRKIEYDREKKTVSLTAIKDSGEEVALLGVTKFTSNKLTVEGEAVLEGLGAATVKYQGGIDKGLQSITFPAPKPAEKVIGAEAVITADDKEKTKHAANDVKLLYLADGQYRIVPYLMFKKTVKIDMDKIASFRFVPSEDKKKASTDYEVTLRDGAMHMLSILSTIEADKKKMTLVGLIGRVPVGYKLFSLDAIYEYRLAEAEKK